MHYMNTIAKHIPAPGSLVSVSTSFLAITHYGIVTDRMRDGLPMIISCSRRRGMVAEESWSEFADGSEVSVVGSACTLPVWEVLGRARAELGRGWDLFRFNCEHFVELAYGRRPQSRQPE